MNTNSIKIELSEKMQISYLVTFVDNGANPGVVLRGTTSHSRTTLKIHHPRQFFVAVLFRLSWFAQPTGTASKEP